MTYTTGSLISSVDFNNINGSTASNSAYASDLAATNVLSALWGVGYGSRGYGQPTPILYPKTTGDIVSGQQWSNLVSVINSCATHTGTTLSSVPSESVFAAGSSISALSFDWLTAVATLDTNRLTADPATMANSASPLITSERTTDWETGVLFEGVVNFGDENAARYFFNSGSNINFDAGFVAKDGSGNASVSGNRMANIPWVSW